MNTLSMAEIQQQFPRSAKYDLDWVRENLMGPNVLWLAESAAQHLDLRPGMRVLDMGCGKAASSIFLAKEFGIQVWATDLWISPAENWQRIVAAGAEESVFPVHAEAHSLPFAEGFFDAVISLDAYHYFGTSELYYGWYMHKLLKPGGQIGIVVPGIRQEIEGDAPPEHLRAYWNWQFYTFHSPAWWQRHWQRTGLLNVEHADWIEDGWKHWLAWQEYMAARKTTDTGPALTNDEGEMLRVDAGRMLGFTRVVARKI